MSERRVTQCVANTIKGQRCKRRTSRTNLCYAHLEKKQHLRIKPSQIPGAGLGLFTTKRRKKHEVVAPYTGRVHSKPDNNWGGDYAIQLTPDSRGAPYKYVDANRTTDSAGRFANAARRRDHKQNNSRLRPAPNSDMARVVATRPILPGREIYTSYGRDYWRGR